MVSALLGSGSARENIIDEEEEEAAAEDLPGDVLLSEPARPPSEQDILDALAPGEPPDDATQNRSAATTPIPASTSTSASTPTSTLAMTPAPARAAPTSTLKLRSPTGTLVMRGQRRKPAPPAKDRTTRAILATAAFVVVAAIGLSAWLAVHAAASRDDVPAAAPTTDAPAARPPR
jgi:hypothetical protein